MDVSALEQARQRAKKRLERLQQQFNVELPAKMAEVQADIERLDKAIDASQTQVDASDLVTKYGDTPPA